MAFIIRGMQEVNEFINQYEDPRTTNWFLMSSPFYTIGMSMCYVLIVKYIGPKLMENRKPFQLRKVLIIYNFLQVVFNLWMFYGVSSDGWFSGNYNWRCQPLDRSNKPATVRILNIGWWYFISKFIDFLDTFFFILTKKFGHISKLHVIHHGIMPVSVWFGFKTVPDGHSTFFGFLNTFVHVIMYSYYMLSAFGPKVRKYLWWKKYITVIQMAQFVAIMVHAFQLLFIECDYPRFFVWYIGLHAIMFYFLFNEFYEQAYKMRGKKVPVGPAPADGFERNGAVHKQNGQYERSSDTKVIKRGAQASDYYMPGQIPIEIGRSVKNEQ